MVKVWLSLGTKTTWLVLGKDLGLDENMYFVKVTVKRKLEHFSFSNLMHF